ncbi:MAG: hypothetical protein PSV46_16275 [Reyranella sp.]|nr:hypothetical protein [Reyranella sp.]
MELSPSLRYLRFVPRSDLYELAEQKRATAEEMRRIAQTLWFCADRDRVMKRAAESEAESKWAILDAAAAVAALFANYQHQAERGAKKGNSELGH